MKMRESQIKIDDFSSGVDFFKAIGNEVRGDNGVFSTGNITFDGNLDDNDTDITAYINVLNENFFPLMDICWTWVFIMKS